jgi:hypothetical protein
MITAASGREEAGELDIPLSCQRAQPDRGIFGLLVSGEMQKPTRIWVGLWFAEKDSNPHSLDQNQMSCHWTIREGPALRYQRHSLELENSLVGSAINVS